QQVPVLESDVCRRAFQMNVCPAALLEAVRLLQPAGGRGAVLRQCPSRYHEQEDADTLPEPHPHAFSPSESLNLMSILCHQPSGAKARCLYGPSAAPFGSPSFPSGSLRAGSKSKLVPFPGRAIPVSNVGFLLGIPPQIPARQVSCVGK